MQLEPNSTNIGSSSSTSSGGDSSRSSSSSSSDSDSDGSTSSTSSAIRRRSSIETRKEKQEEKKQGEEEGVSVCKGESEQRDDEVEERDAGSEALGEEPSVNAGASVNAGSIESKTILIPRRESPCPSVTRNKISRYRRSRRKRWTTVKTKLLAKRENPTISAIGRGAGVCAYGCLLKVYPEARRSSSAGSKAVWLSRGCVSVRGSSDLVKQQHDQKEVKASEVVVAAAAAAAAAALSEEEEEEEEVVLEPKVEVEVKVVLLVLDRRCCVAVERRRKQQRRRCCSPPRNPTQRDHRLCYIEPRLRDCASARYEPYRKR
ncbi:uncharacterized protein DDB_G0271670-like [Cephus cinctus]|uniref:Uncharacterized protein DDB_G0271670-like n=1 Tax=Cephus cinctus TaxID=211228 RepID=A0AAJ7BTM4_CEPCN|nr:uncharacterized protein DDB_G0271670-like [Cephus cinctus]